MIFTSKFFTLASLALVALVVPVVRGVQVPVTVGGPGILQYNPSFVTANPGDVIVFTFMQKNHSATQSSFASPCTSLPGGFDSNFVPVADSVTSNFPQAQLTVQDTNPIWVYCRQANHCEQGMVFAVNPGDKFAAFQAAAMGNSTNTTSTTASSAATGVVTVTATVTVGGSTLTTTYGSYPGSAAPTAAVSTDHKVTVGANGQLVYSPANITAQPGDTVTFEFHQKNHTVTASSFAVPCRALSATTGGVGFDSGFMPVAANATTFPTYTIQINDTKPIWAYCRQSGHCGQGMVFAVNAIETGSNTFEAFQAAAIQQNGSTTTTTTSGSASSPSASSKSSGVSTSVHGAGVVLALIATIAGGLL